MPLTKSSSDEAFKSNLKAELAAGKPRDQSLAIAYAVKRRGRAAGGQLGPGTFNISPKQMVRNEARTMNHVGPIKGIVPGRTDHVPLHVPSSSYVLPADHVSSLGQGNTAAGHAIINHMFAPGGPYNSGAPKIVHGAGAPKPHAMKLSSGGTSEGGPRGNTIGEPVPIMAASGEHVLSPEQVAAVGGGSVDAGHKILDAWVVSHRKKHVKTLKGLPPPAKK